MHYRLWLIVLLAAHLSTPLHAADGRPYSDLRDVRMVRTATGVQLTWWQRAASPVCVTRFGRDGRIHGMGCRSATAGAGVAAWEAEELGSGPLWGDLYRVENRDEGTTVRLELDSYLPRVTGGSP